MELLLTLRVVLVSSILLLLTGCSLFSPVDNSQKTYVLATVNPNVLHAPKTNLTLLVTPPQTSQAYNSTQMAYALCPYTLAYFSKHSWADTPPEMLLPLIVQSLQNTCHYHAVVIPPFGGNYDLALNTQLILLQQEFMKCPSRAHVVLRAQLINNTTQKVIATRQFDVRVIAKSDNPYGGVVAANCAVAKVLQELTQFCLQAS